MQIIEARLQNDPKAQENTPRLKFAERQHAKIHERLSGRSAADQIDLSAPVPVQLVPVRPHGRPPTRVAGLRSQRSANVLQTPRYPTDLMPRLMREFVRLLQDKGQSATSSPVKALGQLKTSGDCGHHR